MNLEPATGVETYVALILGRHTSQMGKHAIESKTISPGCTQRQIFPTSATMNKQAGVMAIEPLMADPNLETPVTSTTLMSTKRNSPTPQKHIRYTVSTHTQPGKQTLLRYQCLQLKAVYSNDIPDRHSCLLMLFSLMPNLKLKKLKHLSYFTLMLVLSHSNPRGKMTSWRMVLKQPISVLRCQFQFLNQSCIAEVV